MAQVIDRLSQAESSPPPRRPVPHRSRHRAPRLVVGCLLVVGVVGLAAASWPQIQELASLEKDAGAITHRVTKGTLRITVVEDGTVESAKNLDVKCKVKGGSSILWIVEDGKEVEEGELLVKLDKSAIEDLLNAQKIAAEKAKAAMIQAQEAFAVAEISIVEYEEGTYVKEQQTAEAQVTIALENLRSAENIAQHTERMARKGFVTPLQVEADRFAVRRAELELDAAKTALMVLEKFTKEKMLKDLRSQRDAANAQMRSEQAAYALEEARLKRLEEQLSECDMYAPQSGMVVYANDSGRRSSSEVVIEEGAAVREQQTILQLPDLSQMQVKVLVHETKVDWVKPGMHAGIDIMGRKKTGKVVSIANQAQRGSWFSSDVKEYETVVSIDGESVSLKPGMSAEVEILVAELKDVLTVPVQAVVEQGDNFYCWVEAPDSPERRPVVLGRTNDQVIEIRDGLKAGDAVLLNPRAYVPEAREEEAETESSSAEDGKGSSQSGAEKPTGGGQQGEAPPLSRPHAAPPGAGSGPPPSGGAPPPGGRGGFSLSELDADGDGRVSREEAPERMQAFFDRLDADADGFINAQEFQAARARRQQQQAAAEGPGGPQQGP